MDDYVVSLIRTWVPVAIGALVTWLATETGIVLDESTSAPLTVAAVGIVTAVYYALARLVEQRWPAVGRILVALGLAGRRTPVYPAPRPAEPHP
ncbi:hypothetical protein ACIBF1_13425 [Spirillospora sp. NPDC050679]